MQGENWNLSRLISKAALTNTGEGILQVWWNLKFDDSEHSSIKHEHVLFQGMVTSEVKVKSIVKHRSKNYLKYGEIWSFDDGKQLAINKV